MEHLASIIAAGQIAAALAVWGGVLTTLGQGYIGAKAVESIARQPESKGATNSAMIIGLAMAETNGIYGLVIAMILLFVNPLGTWFVSVAGSLG
jgi:F-type H+-transporting ATPase subunit c